MQKSVTILYFIADMELYEYLFQFEHYKAAAWIFKSTRAADEPFDSYL